MSHVTRALADSVPVGACGAGEISRVKRQCHVLMDVGAVVAAGCNEAVLNAWVGVERSNMRLL